MGAIHLLTPPTQHQTTRSAQEVAILTPGVVAEGLPGELRYHVQSRGGVFSTAQPNPSPTRHARAPAGTSLDTSQPPWTPYEQGGGVGRGVGGPRYPRGTPRYPRGTPEVPPPPGGVIRRAEGDGDGDEDEEAEADGPGVSARGLRVHRTLPVRLRNTHSVTRARVTHTHVSHTHARFTHTHARTHTRTRARTRMHTHTRAHAHTYTVPRVTNAYCQVRHCLVRSKQR